jgi:DNA-binding CsgD family transcriptional regulator
MQDDSFRGLREDGLGRARDWSDRPCAPSARLFHDVSPALLTARENEIARLIAEGFTNKRMGTVLSISVKTVEAHRMSLMRKIGATSIAGVVRYAVRCGLVEA